MHPAHKDLEIGYALEPISYDITQEKINTYSRYVFYGKGRNAVCQCCTRL